MSDEFAAALASRQVQTLQAGDLVTVDEDVFDVQVAMREHRCPRPERRLSAAAVAADHVAGKNLISDEPVALADEPRCEFVDALSGPWRQRRVVQGPDGSTG